MLKISFIVILAFFIFSSTQVRASENNLQPWWQFQSIDTMKYSRDPSREFLSKPAILQEVSDQQVKAIAETGATHVAIATPYDSEFLPVLKVWVAAARKYHLKIWFRGNWSGWEGWFDHAKISRADHIKKTTAFINDSADLFEDGDIFSACPECENGGTGDPRMNNDLAGHRTFLIAEYTAMSESFRKIDKNVQVNFNSMNADVAKLVMDPATTKALGGLVVIDHYVRDFAKLNADITDIAQKSGGKVILGEYGAPIPDIHGTMTQEQQALWLQYSLELMAKNPNLLGVNYWTGVGGSTAIWDDKNQPKAAVATLTHFFSPSSVTVNVTSPLGEKVAPVKLSTPYKSVMLSDGQGTIQYLDSTENVSISAADYTAQHIKIADLLNNPHIVVQPTHPSFWYRIRLWLQNHF